MYVCEASCMYVMYTRIHVPVHTNHQLLFYVKFARSAFRPPCDLAGDLADLAGDLAGDLPGDLGYSLPPTTLSSSLHCSSLSSWFNASSV